MLTPGNGVPVWGWVGWGFIENIFFHLSVCVVFDERFVIWKYAANSFKRCLERGADDSGHLSYVDFFSSSKQIRSQMRSH